MTNYDVFNGDADGILSLVQLRQIEPKQSVLVTGVKRDTNLLKKVPLDKTAKKITVLDISMEKNTDALLSHLAQSTQVLYVDHHRAGEVPEHDNLNALIDLDANTCTALIVDKYLGGKKHLWAITATYGDNLIAKGDELSAAAGLTVEQAELLKELGTLVNYNGYGESLQDLHYDPAELFKALLKYESPFDCIEDPSSPYAKLKTAYSTDHNKAQFANVISDQSNLLAIELEDAAWARRISGVYGNELANSNVDKAIVVLTKNADNSFRVSLRAPINNKQGAGDICSQYTSGGGRAAAAGVNNLPMEQLEDFLTTTAQFYK